MKKLILNRMCYLILLLLGISALAFMFGVLAPGDPAELALSRGGVYTPTPEQIEKLREEMGQNDPLYIQYFNWLKKILKFDFGTSFANDRKISDLFLEKIPITLNLAVWSAILTIFFGILSGILAASNYHTKVDGFIVTMQNILLSLPQFWVGLILILFFSEKLKLLPTSGYGTAKHMILPAFTLSMASIANISRLTRASFLSEFGENYYTYGVARGIKKRRIVFKHILKNAITPVLPALGNFIGGIIGGSAVVETIFALPGIGSFAIESIFMKDYPVIQMYVLFTGIVFLVFYNVVDILTEIANPKLQRDIKDEK